MFTGLVEDVGIVTAVRTRGGEENIYPRHLRIIELMFESEIPWPVDGCCQTVVKRDRRSIVVVASARPLRKTTLGNFTAGTRVNLELTNAGRQPARRALCARPCGRVTKVTRISGDDTTKMFWFALPKKNASLIIPVGSIAVNGVSLTVARLTPPRLPLQSSLTRLSAQRLPILMVGSHVNIE